MTTKKYNSQLLIFVLPVILTLASLGCGLSEMLGTSSSSNQFAPTRTPMPTFTPTPEGAAFVEVAPITNESESQAQATTEVTEPATVEPSPTSSPTPAEPTATPTPDAVTITVLQNMNV
ncbi:MAG TPA: hypothetical protein VEC93_08460, partial [Anaerolineae bacterium]|nr:hypothetical protein [Anaerolineae bacterium]